MWVSFGRPLCPRSPYLLHQRIDHKIEPCVFEAALEPFGQGRPDGEGNNNIIGVLLGTMLSSQLSGSLSDDVITYMAATPLLLGLRWLSMELSLSEAMMMMDIQSVEDRQRAVCSKERIEQRQVR